MLPVFTRPTSAVRLPEPDRVSAAVLLGAAHALTLHTVYPFANLGQLVRKLVASKTHHTSPEQGGRLRAQLLRPTNQSPADRWVRGFLLVTHVETGRLVSAGVLHAAVRMSLAAPSVPEASLPMTATVTVASCHLASKARELGATAPAAQLFAGSLLRQLSFDCKDVFVAQRRAVSLTVAVDYEDSCPGEVQTALAKGLVEESWRIASWRAAPLSL